MTRSPSEDEAVAIAAAVERFVAETTSASRGQEKSTGPWQRAALFEGVSAKEPAEDSEGGDGWLS